MTTMLSLILAFMLTMGGGPAANINISPGATVIPVNAGNGSSLNLNINEKPRLGEISKIRLFEPMLTAQKARIISLFRITFEKSLLVGYYYYRNRYYMPRIGRFLQTDPTGYMDSMNLYQAFNQNPVNFIDPMGTLTGHGDEFNVMARAGVPLELNLYLNQRARNFNLKVLKNTAIAAGLFVVAAKLSVPALIASGVTLMTYSGMESYSQRKQAGQTEKQAIRGGLGAAFGFNLLFNAMGYDFGTLDEVGHKQVENAWSWIFGGGLGGWLGKKLSMPGVEFIADPSMKNLKSGEVPFDPQKLSRIQKSLEKQGVSFEIGEEAGKFARSRNAEAIYLPDVGKPGTIILDKDPGRTAVIEELLHLGQHRKLKWMNLSKEQIVRLEIEAQKKLLYIGEKLKWTLNEINRIKDALKIWESILK